MARPQVLDLLGGRARLEVLEDGHHHVQARLSVGRCPSRMPPLLRSACGSSTSCGPQVVGLREVAIGSADQLLALARAALRSAPALLLITPPLACMPC